MNLLWSENKKNNIEVPCIEPPTKGAFTQARNKLKHSLVKKMLRRNIKEFDEYFGYNYLWKGLRVFAIDGTKYTLPASKELIEEFGCHKCGELASHYSQALVSVLFNVKSKVAYDVVVEKNYGSERASLKKLCKSLNKNDLVILDRGYPSYEIIDFLLNKTIYFIMRSCTVSTFKFIDDFKISEEKDKIVEIKIKNKSYKIRLIKTEDKEPKIFITSLLNKRFYTYIDICNLYRDRWEIEEHYKANKELFKIENFHSKNKNGIMQEILTQLLFSNITRLVMSQAEKENKNRKDEPSFKNAVFIVENYFIEIALCKDTNKTKELYENMLKDIRRVRYKKRDNRHFPRKSFMVVTKWSKRKA